MPGNIGPGLSRAILNKGALILVVFKRGMEAGGRRRMLEAFLTRDRILG